MQVGIRCMLMRGGTSKGAYFLAERPPSDAAARDRVLLAALGSPDPRQIDGVGGAHPLTSKVAIISRSTAAGIDVDFLFAQVGGRQGARRYDAELRQHARRRRVPSRSSAD